MRRPTLTKAVAALSSVLAVAGLQAGTFTADFNDGAVPAGSAVYGNAARGAILVESTGGVDDSGVLKLTKNLNSQQGSFIIEDLDGGANVYGFRATFMALVGRGTQIPADGWSFSVGPDLPDSDFGEGGAGSGIRVNFDTYDNTDGDPNNATGEAPAINILLGGTQVATARILPLSDLINNNFVPVTIAVNPDGSLDVIVNGKAHFSKYYFPGYTPLAGVRYGFGARTGGLNANHFIDNLTLETFPNPQVGIVQGPQDQTVIEGTPVTFSLTLNNGEGATIAWLRNGSPIPGATDTTYTLPAAALGDSGAKFSARITLAGNVTTSAEATLKVVTLDLPPAPVFTADFNDGAVPAGTATAGTAYVNPTGGTSNSGVLILTEAVNDQNGSFLIDDPNGGAAVYGVAARFNLRAGGGTEPPADGFSFCFGTDLPDAASEEGGGTGLTVAFDGYDNGGGEAPAVTLRYGGTTFAEKKVGSLLRTGDGFADVIVRLTPDGLFDLAWNGIVVFDRQAVPGFSSISGGRFAFYARTGGLNDNHWVDDIRLYSYLTAPLRITRQPQPQAALLGKTATYSVEVSVPAEASYKWFKNGTEIAGATAATYTTPATAAGDNGALFKVEVRGTGVTVMSDEASLTVVDLAPPTSPQISYNFNDGAVPAGAEVAGTALVDTAGGVDDSGVLKLTINENSQNGGFRTPLVENGAQVLGFTLAVDVLAGGGTTPPADGFSINVGTDVPLPGPGGAEDGAGTGITVAFDTYVNADVGETSPTIDIRYKGALVVSKPVPLSLLDNPDTFFTVLLRVKENGTLDLAYGDTVVYAGLQVPGFAPINGARVALYARTGGLNANQWMDNLKFQGVIPASISITTEPSDYLALEGQPATFDVLVSNPTGVTYRWFKNGAEIAGATARSYTTGPLALSDEGTGYSVEVRGPGNTLMSRTARALVLQKFTAGANPVFNFNFDDGLVPPGSAVFGNAERGDVLVDTSGGVNDSGVLKLTEAVNSQMGSWHLNTPEGVPTINDFTATWKMRVGGGSDVPADGFSFVLASDLGDGVFGEDGSGSGLVVSFDIYDNGNGEAPAIDVRFGGLDAAGRKFPISVMRTGDAYADIGVRVNRAGTIDIYYGTTAVFRGLALPEFEPVAAGRFAWGARTGGLNENQWVDNVQIALNTQPTEAPRITSIRKNADRSITVEWTGGGTLEAAPTVLGPWQDVLGATSPYTFTPTAAMLFGRIRQ